MWARHLGRSTTGSNPRTYAPYHKKVAPRVWREEGGLGMTYEKMDEELISSKLSWILGVGEPKQTRPGERTLTEPRQDESRGTEGDPSVVSAIAGNLRVLLPGD